MENKQTSSPFVSLGKTLNEIASTFEWLGGSNRWQLDLKTEKFTSLPPGRGTLTFRGHLEHAPSVRNLRFNKTILKF